MGEKFPQDWNIPDSSRLIQGAQREEHQSSIFSDAYNVVVEHPIATTAAIAAVGGLAWLSRGRAAEALRSEVRAGVAGAAREAEFKAGVAGRATIEGALIPQIERRQIEQGALATGADAFNKAMITAREGYAADLVKLYENAGAMPAEQLAKAATDLQFKHCPPLGQFLKGTGRISEEHVEQALALQKQTPTKKIGEILVEKGWASQADVDLAFSRQQNMKASLKDLFEKFKATMPSSS